MNLTDEQKRIVEHVVCNEGSTLVNSIAGSGKTTLLVSIAKNLSTTNGLYMAYNRKIATEASRKFPRTTNCVTTHSLAYQAVVKANGLKVGFFDARSVKERLTSEERYLVTETLREFCLSRYTSFSDFIKVSAAPRNVLSVVPKYLGLMESGSIDCTHDFYLKFFHLQLLAGNIEYAPFDFIMLDEAGDLNEVTLEIFRLLPSKRKIAVGDEFQNIYTFNHTINCFEVLKPESDIFYMTQSFRVADYIAERIEKFCTKYLDPSMAFKGVPVSSTTINTSAYITRTNSALIGRMIELNKAGKEYGLVRKAAEIFRIPLIFCNLTYQGFIKDPSYRHLQQDVDDWHESEQLKREYKTVFSYLMQEHSEDFQLVQTIKLVTRFGKSAILTAFTEAKRHESARQSTILATAHSCKGLEFDLVEIAPDLNESISDLIMQIATGRCPSELSPAERESLNLYYVACSRARIQLQGASHL